MSLFLTHLQVFYASSSTEYSIPSMATADLGVPVTIGVVGAEAAAGMTTIHHRRTVRKHPVPSHQAPAGRKEAVHDLVLASGVVQRPEVQLAMALVTCTLPAMQPPRLNANVREIEIRPGLARAVVPVAVASVVEVLQVLPAADMRAQASEAQDADSLDLGM